MKDKKNNYQFRYILATSLILIIAGMSIFSIFYSLYQAAKNNIIRTWHNNTIQAAREVEYYLTVPMDAVAFSSATIEEMQKRNVSHEEVGQYLINQTSIYASVVSENTTGVYAYYDGEYLDGSGWIPPADYEPTKRPWYTGGIKAHGEIALIKPYLNQQTFTMMMSVSKMLADGESVVSMDVFLDGVQRMAEEMAQSSEIESALVIDNEGFVVAHSSQENISKDYFKEGDPLQKKLAERLADSKNRQFEMETDHGEALIFREPVGDDWSVVFVLNKDKTFSSLWIIYAALGLALAVVVSVILALFAYVSKKHRESTRLSREVMAMADIYAIVVRINLGSGQMEIIRGNEDLDRILQGNLSDFNGRALDFVERMSSERSKDLMLKFMDPETLSARLLEADSITQEFMDCRGRWIRLRFIVVARGEDHGASDALWAFESIDEDRKQQENLRKLSETDLMTGVKNRGSGEAMVRQAIAEGRRGMFLLLDADDFKSVNDTFGHKVGDKVIITIANSLTNAFRDTDIVFRLGGDEFAVFADGILDKGVGKRVIFRFFDELASAELPELNGRQVTVSIGAAFYADSTTDTFELIYERADMGTYESKRHGGNHVTFFDEIG